MKDAYAHVITHYCVIYLTYLGVNRAALVYVTNE